MEYGFRFCTTPCEANTKATTRLTGNSSHNRQRVKSTQKFPSVAASCRAMPRITAMASTMPTAADAKLW